MRHYFGQYFLVRLYRFQMRILVRFMIGSLFGDFEFEQYPISNFVCGRAQTIQHNTLLAISSNSEQRWNET